MRPVRVNTGPAPARPGARRVRDAAACNYALAILLPLLLLLLLLLIAIAVAAAAATVIKVRVYTADRKVNSSRAEAPA